MTIKIFPSSSKHVCAVALIALSGLALSSPAQGRQLGSLVVSISSPANGATVGATIPVNASVSIIGLLTVAGVQFQLDGVNLGAEDTSAPYSVPWNTLLAGNGSHTLVAVARDALGLRHSSNPVTVTVLNDRTPPAVSITSPAAGAFVGANVSVAAAASDSVGVVGVQFKVDGVNLGAEDTTAPYGATWNTASSGSGTHTLTAVARDAAGNLGTSSAVTVTVDNTAPTVSITAPANGAVVSGNATVSANAADNTEVAGVQFKLDGANLGAEDTTAPYTVAWDTKTATDGSHSLTAIARDAAGNQTTAAAVSVTVTNLVETVVRIEDTSASVTYAGFWVQGNASKPWSGGTAALANGGLSATGEPTRATLTFNGTAVRWISFRGPQTGIAKVYLDGTLAATVDTYSATEELGAVLYSATGLPSGAHTVIVESTGTKNASSSDIFVVVDAFDVTTAGGSSDSTPPTVSITSPAAGTTLSGTIAVTANASDAGGIAGVQFFVDGSAVQAEDTTAPYSADWNTTTAADGSHTLTAVARDAAGNRTTSPGVVINVANGAQGPQPVLTRFEDTEPSIAYTAGSAATGVPYWWHGSRSRAWSNETSSFNRSDGARATFTFTGTSVTWIGFRAPWAGIARIYVDGTFAGELDLYSPTEQVQGRIYTASGLSAGTHTFTVESTGRKNASAADNAVVVDAFDVGPALPPPVSGTRIEDTAAAMTYTTGWSPAGMAAAWSGGAAAASSTVGARATLRFTGTTVSLIGFRGPQMGIARVYLDGAFHSTIDTYAAAEFQGVIFTETNLLPGSHEVVLEVTGQKHAASTGQAIVIDAFDVRTRIEDADSSVSFSGTWTQNFDEKWSGASANYGAGSAARSTTAGSRADFAFTGRSVTLLGYRGPNAGIARVYLDGAFVQEIDTYAATREVQAPLFSTQSLPPGPHTLTFEATGLKNAAATHAFVFLDAFDVVVPEPAPQLRRFQQTDATYPTGVWEQSSANLLFTGGSVAMSSTAGARAEFTFTGTGVRWITQRGFASGIARIFIDGVAVADVDTYAPVQEEYQAPLFTVRNLAPGSHTIRVEVLGQKNAASSSVRILVDAFDVIQ